jgi:tetratricopeptide (TPR) repeat protein
MREALAIRRAALGEHPYVANTLSNLARLLRDRGQLAESETMFREAIALWRATLGDGHPQLSAGLYNLGFVAERRGDLPAAAEAFRQGHEIDRATLPAGHPYIADSGIELGRVLLEDGAPRAAESYLREALAIYTEREGEDGAGTRRARDLLERCQARLHGLAEAKR